TPVSFASARVSASLINDQQSMTSRKLLQPPLRRGSAWLRKTSRRAVAALARVLPLPFRKALVAFVGRQSFPVSFRFEFAMGMLADLQRRDPVALHRFLWSNHLAYAASYEVRQRFGKSNINPTRHTLFRRISTHLRSRGIDPARDIRSVLEI